MVLENAVMRLLGVSMVLVVSTWFVFKMVPLGEEDMLLSGIVLATILVANVSVFDGSEGSLLMTDKSVDKVVLASVRSLDWVEKMD
jgi:hypothetical protein